MVDDRALRLRRRSPVGEPPVQPPAEDGGSLDLDQMFSGYLRNQQAIAEEAGKGGGTLTADALVRNNVVEEGFPIRAAAFVGDMISDPLNIMGAGLAGAGVRAGARTANTYRGMSPQNQALYRSMLRGLYHGSRDTGSNIARPFTAVNRPAEGWARNWFGGDLFGTPSRRVAEGYTTSSGGVAGPGTTARGFPLIPGAKYRLREPIEQVAGRNILDLAGRTLDEADPALYKRLTEEFGQESVDVGTDLAQMVLSGPGLHQSRYSETIRPILEDFGYDTVRYLSGQAQGNVVAPVYAFLNPAGIQAKATLPSVGRALGLTDEAVKNTLGPVFGPVDEAVDVASRAPKTFVDTLASVLSENSLSRLPAPVRNFAEYRTRALPFGENFQDVVPHAVNDRLAAFLRRLGVNRLAADSTQTVPRRRPALPLEDTYEILD